MPVPWDDALPILVRVLREDLTELDVLLADRRSATASIEELMYTLLHRHAREVTHNLQPESGLLDFGADVGKLTKH